MAWVALLIVLGLVVMPFNVDAGMPNTEAARPTQQLVKPGELEALVAPIALYADTLLAQALIASTYPLEVVQADRWVKDRKNAQGNRLKEDVEKQPWDESVRSLVATPSVLEMMSTKLDWTQKLGDALLAQQPDVIDAIQHLRSKAYANKKLRSTKEQTVTIEQVVNGQVVTIEPADPDTVYVPYYDPAVVYGNWPYPDYPPYYYYPKHGYIASGIIATGIAFGTAYILTRWVSEGHFWGGEVKWDGSRIDINRGADVLQWQHNPSTPPRSWVQ